VIPSKLSEIILTQVRSIFQTKQTLLSDNSYYIWIYWINMFAWLLRGLVVNSSTAASITNCQHHLARRTRPLLSRGEATIIRFGFTNSDGEAYTFEWAGWGILLRCLDHHCCFGVYILLVFHSLSTGGSWLLRKVMTCRRNR
jgi:hypothetical protein